MRKWIVASVFFSGSFAFAVDETTLTGQISDDKCNANHSSGEHAGAKLNPHDCVLACIRNGGKYVLISNGQVYKIANQTVSDLEKFAGQTVKLTGELASDDKMNITVIKVVVPEQI